MKTPANVSRKVRESNNTFAQHYLRNDAALFAKDLAITMLFINLIVLFVILNDFL